MLLRMNLDEAAMHAALDVRNRLGEEINVGVVTNLLIRLGACMFNVDEPAANKVVAELNALGGDLALIEEQDYVERNPDSDF